MREVVGPALQDGANLFLFDDLLSRMPGELKKGNATEPDTANLPKFQPLKMLHLLLYYAEMEQDVLVGLRDP